MAQDLVTQGFFGRTLERVGQFVGVSPIRRSSPEDENAAAEVDSLYTRSPETILSASGAYLKRLAVNDDRILQRDGAQDLKLFDHLLDDDVAMSNLQQRRLAITSRDWEVTPGDDKDARSVKAAEDFKDMLRAVGFDRVTGLLHYAIWYGYGVGEALWTTKVHNGRPIIWLEDIVVPDRRWFGFTLEGELRFTAAMLAIAGDEVPANKFVTVRTGGTHDFAFYGLGLAHWVYWPVWFKRASMKFWALYLEKLSNPTALGEFKESDTVKEKNKLLAALVAIGRDSAVIVPEGSSETIKFMEATRTGVGGSSYKEFVTEQNEAIMRIVLGQPGTSKATPQGVGGKQSEVHEDVKAEIVKADADLICDAINNTLAKWVTRWNYGEDVAPPTVFRILDDAEDLNSVAERDAKLEQMGWIRTEESIEQVYGEGYERKPEPDPATLVPPGPGGQRQPPAANDDEEKVRRNRAQFAAGDEVPLYVQRKLKNVGPFRKWALSVGFKDVETDLHVTLIYSKTPVDPFALGETWSTEITVPEGGARKLDKLGEGAIVLRFGSAELRWRHDEMIERGASSDYADYKPHVTITYNGEGVDLDAIEPYQGPLIFGPEMFEPIDAPTDPLSMFAAVEEEEIERLAEALVDETNPLLAEFAATVIDTLKEERVARGGVLSVEGARVALLQAFERFPTAALARLTGLPFVAERAAAEIGVEDRITVA